MTNKSWGVLLFGWVLVIYPGSSASAHEKKTALTDIFYNERAGTLEVAHRFSLHDAEHTLHKVTESKADLSTSPEARAAFAKYVAEHFALWTDDKKPLKLTMVGQEVERGYLWVYQETKIPKPLDSPFSIENTILHSVVKDQINTVNVRFRSQVKTFVFEANAGRKRYEGTAALDGKENNKGSSHQSIEVDYFCCVWNPFPELRDPGNEWETLQNGILECCRFSNSEDLQLMSNEESSLYDRMGGEVGISEMVDDFYGRVLSNPELAPFFKNVPIDRLQRMQREFFGAATGGPIIYSGKPLAHVHHNLGITRRHFQQFTEHLIETLEDNGIDQKEIGDLISKVNVYADEIIGDVEV